MQLKYVDVNLEDLPEVSAEEFKKLPKEEQQKMMVASIMNMRKRMFLMAAATVHYGVHLESCTEEDKCTCGFDEMLTLADDMMSRIAPQLDAQDYTVN